MLTSDSPGVRIAPRLALAHAWWFAAALSRRRRYGTVNVRHDVLSQEHEGASGLMGLSRPRPFLSLDCLDEPMIYFDLDFGAFAPGKPKSELVPVLTWSQMLGAKSPHDVVRHLEAANWAPPPHGTPPPTKQVLVNLAIARILMSRANDTEPWQAAPITIPEHDSFDVHEVIQHMLRDFRTARTAAAQYSDEVIDRRYWGEPFPPPGRPLWRITRDGKPVIVLDEGGFAHLRNGIRYDLYELYNAVGKDVDAMASLLLLKPDRTQSICNWALHQHQN